MIPVRSVRTSAFAVGVLRKEPTLVPTLKRVPWLVVKDGQRAEVRLGVGLVRQVLGVHRMHIRESRCVPQHVATDARVGLVRVGGK